MIYFIQIMLCIQLYLLVKIYFTSNWRKNRTFYPTNFSFWQRIVSCTKVKLQKWSIVGKQIDLFTTILMDNSGVFVVWMMPPQPNLKLNAVLKIFYQILFLYRFWCGIVIYFKAWKTGILSPNRKINSLLVIGHVKEPFLVMVSLSTFMDYHNINPPVSYYFCIIKYGTPFFFGDDPADV